MECTATACSSSAEAQTPWAQEICETEQASQNQHKKLYQISSMTGCLNATSCVDSASSQARSLAGLTWNVLLLVVVLHLRLEPSPRACQNSILRTHHQKKLIILERFHFNEKPDYHLIAKSLYNLNNPSSKHKTLR